MPLVCYIVLLYRRALSEYIATGLNRFWNLNPLHLQRLLQERRCQTYGENKKEVF